MMKLPLPKLPTPKTFPAYTGVGFVPGRDEQLAAIKASGQKEVDTYDLIMQVMSGLTAGLESYLHYDVPIENVDGRADHIPLKSVAYGAHGYVDGRKLQDASGQSGLDALARKRNPLFETDHLEIGTPNPVTQAYLVSRRRKKIAASAIQATGDLLNLGAHPAGTAVGATDHGNASASTAMHMAKLGYIAHRRRAGSAIAQQQVRDWCKLLQTMKDTKLAIRGTQMAGSLVPAASAPASIAAAILKGGIKLTWTGACYAAAAQLMYEAYLEQTTMVPTSAPQIVMATAYDTPRAAVPTYARAAAAVTGSSAGTASAVVWEIFTRRGITRIFGSYDIAALVREPAGWMALADKFMLI